MEDPKFCVFPVKCKSEQVVIGLRDLAFSFAHDAVTGDAEEVEDRQRSFGDALFNSAHLLPV